jgi:hypothetical protein
MYMYILSTLIFILSIGCMKTMTLENGRTKVPVEAEVYRNRSKFNESLLKIIDTSVVYKHVSIYGISSKAYWVYRFYPNGQFNLFIIDADRSSGEKDFDPKFNGYRGVYYLEKNRIRFDRFGPINENRQTGKLTGTFNFNGDTLFVVEDKNKPYSKSCIKYVPPPEYMQYKADW